MAGDRPQQFVNALTDLFLAGNAVERHDWRRFDPLLFLRMITAAVKFSGNKVRQALQILAVAPGDTDTMTTLLGSIVGAYRGESALPEEFGFQDLNSIRSAIFLVSIPCDIDIFNFPAPLMKIAENKCWKPADDEE